jgi:ferrous iron transport protein B
VLVGSPNVGKSSLFNALSGSYTVVSNYPGTSVEISRGKGRIGGREYEIIDTPGMYSLLPVSEEERVSQRLLFEEDTFIYLHVVDARNLRRMLSLTLQLLEARLPLILVLNMMDEARERGIEIDLEKLSNLLGVPVIGTVSSERKGIEELKVSISNYTPEENAQKVNYGMEVEPYISEVEESWLESIEETNITKNTSILKKARISKRAFALLLLLEDKTALEYTAIPEKEYGNKKESSKKAFEGIERIAEAASIKAKMPLSYLLALKRQERVNEIVEQVMNVSCREKENKEDLSSRVLTGEGPWEKEILASNPKEKVKKGAKWREEVGERKTHKKNIMLSESIDNVLTHPILGVPVLFLVLYFGLYRFVGVFAAGTVVDFLENTVFGEHISPWLTAEFTSIVPYPVLQDLFVGEYGIFTQAMTYAIALILPIVGSFFLVFSVIEDAGYLPRLCLLLDGMFKKMGLSGRAVIPMILGFGCSTMATVVTRTLETRRERLIANILLALAIPCSAQLGIILSILSGNPKGLLIWAGVIGLEFIFIGYLASRILPGEAPTFILEMPPLRRPRLSNIAVKTYSRMQWYFLEVLPLFILGSFLIWIGKLTGLFDLALKIMEYPTVLIGLPPDAADVFLFGFFRRDYGAAGLYGMHDSGLLTGLQLVVAAVTLTLFMPCIAQFMMTIKERGLRTALLISGFIFPFAFFTGFIVNTLLKVLGVNL